MRVLVTGGCGFIGSHIVNDLEKDHEVLVVDNLSSGKKERVSCRVEVVNICDTKKLKGLFTEFKPEVVIHTAAHIQVREALENPIMNAENNVIGTISVLEACKAANVSRVLYTSTGGARYGDPESLPVSEAVPADPLSPYAISKVTAEVYVQFYAHHGIEHLILCFGNVYGPRDEPESKHIIPIVIHKFLSGEAPTIFGDGEQTRDFLYVGDIVTTVRKNLTSTTGLFNLASGEKTSVNTICSAISEELETDVAPEHTEAIAGEVRDIQLDISKARAELGFSPTPLREGLRETVAWMKERSR